MCLICIEVAKGAMTASEARRALGEMRAKVGAAHAREIEAQLEDPAGDGASQATPPSRP